mgnify:FL=1
MFELLISYVRSVPASICARASATGCSRTCHAGRAVNADILVVNKQKFGLFFDLIHYLRHFHLLHINSHTACLRPDGPGGKAQKRSKKGDYQVL